MQRRWMQDVPAAAGFPIEDIRTTTMNMAATVAPLRVVALLKAIVFFGVGEETGCGGSTEIRKLFNYKCAGALCVAASFVATRCHL